MSCAPGIPSHISKAIKDIHRSWRIQWNPKIDRWEIWGRTPLGQHYMVDRLQYKNGAYRPLDRRIINQLRWAMWIQKDPARWRRYLHADDARMEAREQRIEKDENDLSLQVGKDMYRPMQMLARHLGYDSGKTKIPTIQGADIK